MIASPKEFVEYLNSVVKYYDWGKELPNLIINDEDHCFNAAEMIHAPLFVLSLIVMSVTLLFI